MKRIHENQSGVGAVVIIVTVAVVIGVIALLWWAFTRSDDNQTQTTEPVTINGTYFDAIATGRALECDWTLDYDGEALVSEGKLYTDGADRGLSEATTTSAKPTYTLVTDQYVYNWVGEAGTSGTQVNRTNVEGLPFDEALVDNSESIDLNANYVFDCQAWTVDESKLAPPSDVNFLDLTDNQ